MEKLTLLFSTWIACASLGAWIVYALGTANPDLPPYVVLYDGEREPTAGSQNWNSGFLPAIYQGVAFRPGNSPILYLDRPDVRAAEQQRASLDLLKRLNNIGAARYPSDTELRARLKSYDLADRMQVAAPAAVDLSKETEATKALYGIGDEISGRYGETLLPARGTVATAAVSLAALVAIGALAYGLASFALWRACLRPPGAESAVFGMLRQIRLQRLRSTRPRSTVPRPSRSRTGPAV